MEVKTTMLFNDATKDVELTGTEQYPITGKVLNKKEVTFLMTQLQGLKRTSQCFEKTIKISNALQAMGKHLEYQMFLGEVTVWSKTGTSNFQYQFHLPYEFHAWLQIQKRNLIIDFALPGMIEYVSTVKDEIGFLVEGRKPCILAGIPPSWLVYKPRQLFIVY